MTRQIGWGALAVALVLSGCSTKHQVDSRHQMDMTHDVKPIHITLDINLKVDRELDNFFDDIDNATQQGGE